ncbi:MAG: hypothetical protein WC055_16930 [Melioribacteraceae bacterium]
MTFDKAKNIFDALDCTKLHSLRDTLIETAIRYSEIRVKWYFADDDMKREIDEERTRIHNVFIDSSNILSRAMIKEGENADWRLHLGNDRKLIGDFACYINLFIGLKSR